MNAPHPRWLVLYCRPRFEFKLYDAVEAEGITIFLPTREELRQWSDRKKRITVPLFPGYLFARVTEHERILTLEKPGALKYVGFGGRLSEVSEETIQNLRIAVTRPRSLSVERGTLKLGQKVKVMEGPFAGMTGKLFEFRGTARVAIQVEAIAQTVLVEVPVESIITVS